jgi:hypothetical protein
VVEVVCAVVVVVVVAPVPVPWPWRFILMIVAAVHGPSASPWAKCARTAGAATVMATNGFVFDLVRWQIVTLAGGVDPEVVPVVPAVVTPARPPPLAIATAAKPPAARSAMAASGVAKRRICLSFFSDFPDGKDVLVPFFGTTRRNPDP